MSSHYTGILGASKDVAKRSDMAVHVTPKEFSKTHENKQWSSLLLGNTLVNAGKPIKTHVKSCSTWEKKQSAGAKSVD